MATRTEAMKPTDLARVIVDTTVQPKAVMFPTDAKLLNRARERRLSINGRYVLNSVGGVHALGAG